MRDPASETSYGAEVALLKDRLGEEAFDRAWSEGRAMSLDQATTYAQRGRGERRRPSSGWASLTPTELEVARLVAIGLSNPKIAERLFISRHTVESHLKHIFAKLDFSSRTELATEVTRRGL
jgi:DNA-binding CsgD family transcriptional regulator